MKAAAFLTGEGPALLRPAQVARAERPGAALVLFVRDDDRAAVQAACPDAELRRDKPAGGRVAFVRALRAERFDLVVVAWQGGERVQPLKLVALFAGAARTLVVDRRDRVRPVRWSRPWTWGGAALVAVASIDPLAVLLAFAACYRWTIGLLIGATCLAAAGLAARLRRRAARAGWRGHGPAG